MSDDLTDESELLFRQIHPDLMQNGEPSSSGFRPKDSDQNMLSVDRSTVTTASGSHALYTGNGYKSAATYGLSVGEFNLHDISCRPDPLTAVNGRSANPAHALADFSKHGTSKQKTLAKKIKKLAVARGVLHPVDTSTEDDI
jgi:hypothetical protein